MSAYPATLTTTKKGKLMKFQLITALIVLALTLVGILTLPTLMAQAVAIFGIGCSALAIVFALIIAKTEAI